MEAFKFLDDTGSTVMTEFRWPRPEGPGPGDWVEATGAEVCREGVHGCGVDHLSYWISDQLWVMELDGPVDQSTHKLVARRGRLVRPVPTWADGVRSDLASDVVWRTRDLVLAAVGQSGDQALGDLLAAPNSLGQLAALQDEGSAAVIDDEGLGTAVLLASDCAFGAESLIPAAAPFAAAHTAGYVARLTTGDPAAYDVAFHAERARQSGWIAERLGL